MTNDDVERAVLEIAAPDMDFFFDWSSDPTFVLDGQKCVDCGGVLVAEPVELCEPTIVRCRECGGVA